MKQYKVHVRKEDKTRGVINYVEAADIALIERFAIDELVCRRYHVDYADNGKMGISNAVEYLMEEPDHHVIKFHCELGLPSPIDFSIDIQLDESRNKKDFLVSSI